MNICYLECDESVVRSIHGFELFAGSTFLAVEFPLTAIDVRVDLLVVGPGVKDLLRLAATISDWKLPPVSLFILPVDGFDLVREGLEYHPRVGRSLHFCKNTGESIEAGLLQVHTYFCKRRDVGVQPVGAEQYTLNNVSPRWLFYALMEYMDEFIYFKDRDSRFLAASRYFLDTCRIASPEDILGMTDFEVFPQEHATKAYEDERQITQGEIGEISKEEHVTWGSHDIWVYSRKLPLRTRSGYLVGTFGMSRDVTVQKKLYAELESNHARMKEELLLARQLQHTLLARKIPVFVSPEGLSRLDVAAKYIPSFHLSGDFYAILKTPGGGAGILVADVMGHGVRSAMVTAMILVAVEQLQQYVGEPKEFMQRLNYMLHSSVNRRGHILFATAIYCHLDFGTGRLSYTQAGARHGVILSGDCCESLHGKVGPALGLLEQTTYPEASYMLKARDQVVLYTDGLIEACGSGEDAPQFGEDRLRYFLLSNHFEDMNVMLDGLLGEVIRHHGSREIEDDLCLVAFRVPDPVRLSKESAK